MKAKNTNFSGAAWSLSLILLAFCCAIGIHLANHYFLSVEQPDSLRDGISVKTADDASYIRPAINFLTSGTWKSSNPGQGSYVTRSPGYGMIYGSLVYFFGERNGLSATILIQLLLWSVAVGMLPLLAQYLGFNKSRSYFLTIFVAVMPMFYGFLSYTLTEALTPSMVIIFYTLLFLGVKNDARFLFVSALVLGFSLLVRPALVLLVLSYLPFIGILKKRLVLILTLALTPLFIWQLRVHRFTDRYDLHPIYHSDAADLYRPLHETIWDFHKMTGQTGKKFHTSMNLLWEAARGNVEEDYAASIAIRSMDHSVIQTFGGPELGKAYYAYIDVLRQQMPYHEANRAVDHELIGEKELSATFDSLRAKYVAQNFLRAWVTVPLKVSGSIIFHSNLSPYLFQKALRGNLFIEVLRWVSFITHSLIFGVILFSLFRKKSKVEWALLLPAVVFFFYLIFIQRGVEERYMLPFLVPMFLIGVSFLSPHGLKRVFGKA